MINLPRLTQFLLKSVMKLLVPLSDKPREFWAKWSPLFVFGIPMAAMMEINIFAVQMFYRSLKGNEYDGYGDRDGDASKNGSRYNETKNGTRYSSATDNISSFGIAFNILMYFHAFTQGLVNTVVLKVWSKQDLKKAAICSYAVCCCIIVCCAFIGLTSEGGYIFKEFFTENELSLNLTRKILFILSGSLLFDASLQLLWGLFIQEGYATIVTLSTILLGGTQVLTVATLIDSKLAQTETAYIIPLASVYVGYILSLLVTVCIFAWKIWKKLPAKQENAMTIKSFGKIYIPLTINYNAWFLALPLAKSIMSKTTVGSEEYITKELAVTSVTIPAGQFLVYWLRVIDLIVLTFGNKTNPDGSLKYQKMDFFKLTLFYTGLACLLIGVFVWIQPIQNWYLDLIMDLPANLMGQMSTLLKIRTANALYSPFHLFLLGIIFLNGETGLVLVSNIIGFLFLVGTVYLLAYVFHIGGALQVTIAVQIYHFMEPVVLGILLCCARFIESKFHFKTKSDSKAVIRYFAIPELEILEKKIQKTYRHSNYDH